MLSLLPSWVLPGVITAALSAVMAFGSAWQIQNWRFDAKEKQRVEQQLTDQRTSAATAIRRVDAVSQAQSTAAVRLGVLRRSAGAARNELDGLRTSSAEALRVAGASLDACTATAATLGRLLNQCGAEYQDLGAVADRHVSDIKTLTEAWPK